MPGGRTAPLCRPWPKWLASVNWQSRPDELAASAGPAAAPERGAGGDPHAKRAHAPPPAPESTIFWPRQMA
jgi:hypothetical protein